MTNLADLAANALIPAAGIADDVLGASRLLLIGSARAVNSNTAAGSPYPMESQSADGGYFFYFDPADYAVAGRTTKLRVRGQVYANDVAPGVNFTLALHQMTNIGNPMAITAAVAAGAVVNNPGVNGRGQAVSADFDAPAAGWYCLGMTVSGTPAVSSFTEVGARLLLRHV